MTQQKSDDTGSEANEDLNDSSLFDELGSVSTLSFPAVKQPPSIPPDSAGSGITGRDEIRSQAQRHRRMIILTVVLSVVAVSLIAAGIYFVMRMSRQHVDDISTAYATAVQVSTQNRDELREELDSTKDGVARLTAKLPTSSEIQEFSETWTSGQKLVDEAPEVLTATPETTKMNDAISELNEYSTSLSNVTKRLKSQEKSAGKTEATTLLTNATAGLKDSITQAEKSQKNYEESKEKYGFILSSDEAATDNEGADTKADTADGDASTVVLDARLVDDFTSAFDSAKDLLNQKDTEIPAVIVDRATQMDTASSTLKSASDALQKGVSTAVDSAEHGTDSADYEALNGQIPAALLGVWKTQSGTTLTFGPTSLQNSYAYANRADTSAAASMEGGTPLASWTLSGNGQPNGIEDTTATLYKKDGQQVLVVTTASNQWVLTR